MSVTLLAVPLLASASVDIAQVPEPDYAQAAAMAQAASVPAPAAPSLASDEGAPQGDVPGQNEIVVSGRAPSPADPVEKVNEVSYEAVQAIDGAIIAPVTHAYSAALPRPLREGMHNALNNLDEPIVFLNFLLQLKPGKALETLGRFTVNTTLGLGGLMDVAKKKPFNLPRRSNGLADTLGYYGVPTGPYLFLPLIGATTLRDAVARPFDLMVLPAIVPKPFANPAVSLGKGTLSAIDDREENDGKFTSLRSANDPYAAQREEYLARRRAEIEVLRGKRKSIDDPPYYVLPQPAAPPASSPADGRP